MWEFIGGKAEPGETRELALIHEGIPRNLEHYETRRIAVHEIEQYTFNPVDKKIWRRLEKCLLKPITSWCVTASQR